MVRKGLISSAKIQLLSKSQGKHPCNLSKSQGNKPLKSSKSQGKGVHNLSKSQGNDMKLTAAIRIGDNAGCRLKS